jgi:16S rRNA C967 or C1407 C5-methylase (RsmB/RsmF family)/NOL1/NOP2/fmu family ribosome biogenesis protein
MKKDLSLPPAFARRMESQLGPEYGEFLNSLQQPAPVSIRLNAMKKCTTKGQPVPWCDSGIYLAERPSFTLDPEFHAGAYYVQEASSMLLEQAVKQHVALDQPLRVLDLCAAPGGKSTHLLSLISSNSLLVSNEVIRSRVPILSENIQKWGYPNVVVTNNDPVAIGRLRGFFDVILVDAPCSGEGLFRKDPDSVHHWSVENASLCASRQQRILLDVWPALKENGILIYSSCTYNPEENENNLKRLSEEKSMMFLPLQLPESWGVEELRKGHVTGYRCLPHHVAGEGFFIAAMRKQAAENPVTPTRSKNKWLPASNKISVELSDWLSAPEQFSLVSEINTVLAIPTSLLPAVQFLSDHLNVLHKGVALAEVKQGKKIPEHALALSAILQKRNFPAIELDKTQAIAYLRRDNLRVDDRKKGFALITFRGNLLGWVNVLDQRINNLYPSSWRIRMSV